MQDQYEKAVKWLEAVVRDLEVEAGVPKFDSQRRQDSARFQTHRVMDHDREFRDALSRGSVTEEQWNRFFELEQQYRDLIVKMHLNDPWQVQ